MARVAIIRHECFAAIRLLYDVARAGEMCVGFFESSHTDQCDRGVHVIALGIGSAPEYSLVGAECRAGLSFRFPEVRALGAP